MPIAAFATADQLTDTERMIKYVLNATGSWSGAINDARRMAEAVTKSRIWATIEVVTAIAENRSHGFWGALAEMYEVDHNELLPPHRGEHGIPQITVSGYDEEIAGIPADPDDIDSWRNDTLGLHSRLCGETVPHDTVDSNGVPSHLAGKYSIVNSLVKFTGESCEVPIIRFDEARCATKTPEFALPTIVKLAVWFNQKEGDNIAPIAMQMYQAAQADLEMIRGGALKVNPISDVMQFQKEL